MADMPRASHSELGVNDAISKPRFTDSLSEARKRYLVAFHTPLEVPMIFTKLPLPRESNPDGEEILRALNGEAIRLLHAFDWKETLQGPYFWYVQVLNGQLDDEAAEVLRSTLYALGYRPLSKTRLQKISDVRKRIGNGLRAARVAFYQP